MADKFLCVMAGYEPETEKRVSELYEFFPARKLAEFSLQ